MSLSLAYCSSPKSRWAVITAGSLSSSVSVRPSAARVTRALSPDTSIATASVTHGHPRRTAVMGPTARFWESTDCRPKKTRSVFPWALIAAASALAIESGSRCSGSGSGM